MIGSQSSLAPSGANPPPKPVLKAQPSPSGRGMGGVKPRPPKYIDTNTTEDAVNNVMAQGQQQADARYQLKQLDKAGISRGRGQQYIAAQEGASAVSKAASQAAEMRLADEATNSKMRSEYEKTSEEAALRDQANKHDKSETDWATQYQRATIGNQLRMARNAYWMSMRMAMINNT